MASHRLGVLYLGHIAVNEAKKSIARHEMRIGILSHRLSVI